MSRIGSSPHPTTAEAAGRQSPRKKDKTKAQRPAFAMAPAGLRLCRAAQQKSIPTAWPLGRPTTENLQNPQGKGHHEIHVRLWFTPFPSPHEAEPATSACPTESTRNLQVQASNWSLKCPRICKYNRSRLGFLLKLLRFQTCVLAQSPRDILRYLEHSKPKIA